MPYRGLLVLGCAVAATVWMVGRSDPKFPHQREEIPTADNEEARAEGALQLIAPQRGKRGSQSAVEPEESPTESPAQTSLSAGSSLPGRIELHDALTGAVVGGGVACDAWRAASAWPQEGTFQLQRPEWLSLAGWSVRGTHEGVHVESPQRGVPIGLRTRSLFAIQPLRRVVRVCVEVFDHDGRPAVDPRVVAKMTGVKPSTFVAQPRSGSACCELRLPYLPRETVEISCGSREGDAATTLDLVIEEGDHLAERYLPVRLPVPDPEAFLGPSDNGMLGIGGGATGVAFGRRSRRASGTVHLLALGRDGVPLANLALNFRGPTWKSALTDAEGRVTLELEAGEYKCTVVVPGVVAFDERIEVAPNAVTSYTLREPEEAVLEVHVVDANDNALPYARIEVEPARGEWVDEQDGVQRIDPFTDVHGRRRIGGLPAGRARVVVRWASRSQTSVVVCAAGSALPFKVVLAAPDRPVSVGEPR